MKPENAALPGRLGILPWTSSAQCSPCLNTSCREHRGGVKKSWILCRGLKLTKPAQPGGERGAGLECVREERGRPRCRCVRGCLSALSSARALGRCGRSARPGAAALSRARPRWPQSLPRPGFPRLAVHSSLQHHLQFLGYKLRWLYRGCRVACLLFTKERNIRVRPQQSLERGQVSSDRLDFVLLSLQTLSSSFQRNAARTWLMLRLQ